MAPAMVRRGSLVLHADPTRVLAKLFLPGQETLANGLSRADAVLNRVLAMTEEQADQTLSEVLRLHGDRHAGLRGILEDHFTEIAHRLSPDTEVPRDRRALIGSYFTQEYALEAAALFNPSMVAHPDQSGLLPGELRFIMSVRAVGEGHVSSIEFRTGVLTGDDGVQLDDPGPHVVAGRPSPRTLSRDFLAAALAEHVDQAHAELVLRLLPERFDADDFDAVVAVINRDRLTRASAETVIAKVRWILSCNYDISVEPDRALSEVVLFPYGADERQGMEDARFTHFVEDSGTRTYYGTYTAFDGGNIAPHLISTEDFLSFEVTRLLGPAAKNKGMAIFPRRVGGEFLALSRWDRESIGIASSADGRLWSDAVTIQTPEQPWEVIQLGNCGPPIETEAGWLVLTHGVGPMRNYAIGATLLDLDQPTQVLGTLRNPLLSPNAEERDGYVPNVVYSCGALRHGDTLVMPYGCSDSAIRVAFIDLPTLLSSLRPALGDDGPAESSLSSTTGRG